jgi:hypothetical protein
MYITKKFSKEKKSPMSTQWILTYIPANASTFTGKQKFTAEKQCYLSIKKQLRELTRLLPRSTTHGPQLLSSPMAATPTTTPPPAANRQASFPTVKGHCHSFSPSLYVSRNSTAWTRNSHVENVVLSASRYHTRIDLSVQCLHHQLAMLTSQQGLLQIANGPPSYCIVYIGNDQYGEK